ncbi:MAG: hypothetical protein ACJ762_15620 [Solirubrobacteraceae bacterium]
MNRWIPVILSVAIAAFAIAALTTGEAVWVVPVLILLVIVGAMAAAQFAFTRRAAGRAGEPTAPATHLDTADETALGDTDQAHDEITPHDLPKDHPGRAAAEREARHSREGVVQGNVER